MHVTVLKLECLEEGEGEGEGGREEGREGGREGERKRERVEECGCRETSKWEIWRCVG